MTKNKSGPSALRRKEKRANKQWDKISLKRTIQVEETPTTTEKKAEPAQQDMELPKRRFVVVNDQYKKPKMNSRVVSEGRKRNRRAHETKRRASQPLSTQYEITQP